MGFKIKKIIKSAAQAVAGNALRPLSALGSAAGIVGAGNLFGGKAPSEGAPGEDPMVAALRKKMTQEATDYRNDMPGMMRKDEQMLNQDAGSALDSGQRNVRSSFNNRGLLYSGVRQGAEGDLRNQVSSQLARGLNESRAGFEKTARGKEEAAANVGMASYNDAVKRSEDNFKIATESSIARRQAMQQLGQAGGYAVGVGAGGGYGSRKPTTQATSTGTNTYGSQRAQPGLMGDF